ncbi:ornithine cyclodeaminase family protein [Marinobacter sp. JSM 1782161]|uniref:ornithine cyclodeaminase family protein n=1 Tax=Marinobacter sp. JSM 1782161 TaxID=2685906 RepID=UPI0014037BDC|nr:ornithine cyclodeaminase [Marinobacter sp. JSM 1782161]
MSLRVIQYEAAVERLSWRDAIDALRAGHRAEKADVDDIFLGPAKGTLLNRAAYLPGQGYGVKAVTVFDENPSHGLDTVQGAMMVFEPEHGALSAIIESRLVTEYKTAGDSVLGAQLLARPDSRHLVIAGAGTLARSLIRAYTAGMPALERISVWARRPEQAQQLADEMSDHSIEVVAAADLEAAVATADIVSTATMARSPILKGAWVRPGTHVDLIGAYKADMREADDALIADHSLFVDSRDTTLGHIGELKIPIANGVITADDVKGDLYDMIQNGIGRESDQEVTVYKNGGGAHLDTMIGMYIASVMK